MNDFRQRLKAAMDKSKYRNSARSLSLAADLGERTVANMLSNEAIDSSKTGPGLFSMSRVANLLGVSLDWLAGRDDLTPPMTEGDKQFSLAMERFAATSSGQFTQGNRPPNPQAMQRLYVRSGGRLEAFESVLKYCDRYNCLEPDAKSVSVKAVGQESLAALTMGSNDAGVLQIALSTVPDEAFRKRLVDDHLETQRRGCLCTVETLDVQMPNKPVRVKMDYIRVLLHVADSSGKAEILSYSALIV